MNNKVKIIADSTCDLPQAILDKYDISIIPLCIIMDDVLYYDGVDITSDEMIAWSQSLHLAPKTSSPPLADVIDFIKPYVDENRDIIFIGISEELSSTCNVVRLAGDCYQYNKLYVVDSRNLSNGIGLQVIKAAILSMDGMGAGDIVSYIQSNLVDRIRTTFILDTLDYLAWGGRCSSCRYGPVIFLKKSWVFFYPSYLWMFLVNYNKYP